MPAGPIYSVADMFADPQFAARGLFEEVATPQGPLKVPAILPKLADTPGRTEFAGGEVGADNEEVLGGLLGLSAAEIAALRERGVLPKHCSPPGRLSFSGPRPGRRRRCWTKRLWPRPAQPCPNRPPAAGAASGAGSPASGKASSRESGPAAAPPGAPWPAPRLRRGFGRHAPSRLRPTRPPGRHPGWGWLVAALFGLAVVLAVRLVVLLPRFFGWTGLAAFAVVALVLTIVLTPRLGLVIGFAIVVAEACLGGALALLLGQEKPPAAGNGPPWPRPLLLALAANVWLAVWLADRGDTGPTW